MTHLPSSATINSIRRIGPVSIAALGLGEALDVVAGMLARREPSMIAFCNAHTVNMAVADQSFAAALDGALVLNDGVGVDIGSLVLHGRSFPANLNGTDFTPALLEHVKRPLRLFLLGSKPGVVEQAAEELGSRFPVHQIVGMHHGYFAASDEAALARTIAAARPDLILVGMGHPRQELWAKAHWGNFQGITMCIGAFLDFSAGVVPRAPWLVRKLRCEWLFRLVIEPRRLAGRYLLGNARFLAFCLAERLRQAKNGARTAKLIEEERHRPL